MARIEHLKTVSIATFVLISWELCAVGFAQSATPYLRWDLNENSGLVASDSSGNDIHGRIHGAQWVRYGKLKALSFDGRGDHITANNVASLEKPSSLSVSAWVLPKDTSIAYAGIVDKGWKKGGFVMDIDHARPRFSIQSATGHYYTAKAPAPLQPDIWHHLVGVYESHQLRIFVNGKQAAATKLPEEIGRCNLGLVIGGDGESTNHFKGQLKNIAIYTRPLSNAEIEESYAMTCNTTRTPADKRRSKAQTAMGKGIYQNELEPISKPLPILADYPKYVHPMEYDRRFQSPPIVNDKAGQLRVRAWRYSYNARGIVEMENQLSAAATALIVVHPWGIDDQHGLQTPEPAGAYFFCTPEKNRIAGAHIREVLNPFLARIRKDLPLIGFSLAGPSDALRRGMYPSIHGIPNQKKRSQSEQKMRDILNAHRFTGGSLPGSFPIKSQPETKDYFKNMPSLSASSHYNGAGFRALPLPLTEDISRAPEDVVFFDKDGYPAVRDYLKARGIRHILLAGYATNVCVAITTCGYRNLKDDFNVFLVGDATLAIFPASKTPKYATQAALATASCSVMITQINWVNVR